MSDPALLEDEPTREDNVSLIRLDWFRPDPKSFVHIPAEGVTLEGLHIVGARYNGIYIKTDDVVIRNCYFSQNYMESARGQGGRGGAIYTETNVVIKGSTFTCNGANRSGGAVWGGGSWKTVCF